MFKAITARHIVEWLETCESQADFDAMRESYVAFLMGVHVAQIDDVRYVDAHAVRRAAESRSRENIMCMAARHLSARQLGRIKAWAAAHNNAEDE